MPQLNQIIAVRKGLTGRTEREVTDVYKQLQKKDLFGGLSRVYTPKEDGGEQLPPEDKRVQHKAPDLLDTAAAALKKLFDVTATLDNGNTLARADVKIGGVVIVAQAPVPLLLFLEKQLVDWRTQVSALPVLDTADDWRVDPTTDNLFRTDPVQSNRSKKVHRNWVKAEATDKHPAQVEIYFEDVPIGSWSTTKLSGAVPSRRKDELVERANELIDAVKQAREVANSMEIPQVRVGQDIFDYLLA